MKGTMLIVDDTELNREILKILFAEKYEFLEADNGREALRALESCRGNVDVLLLDLSMPTMDGFAVLTELKKLDYAKDVPVVVITGSGSVEDQVRAFTLGAKDYVTKPFIPEIVLSRVENVTEARRRIVSMELEAAKLKTRAELDLMTSLYNKTTCETLISEALRNDPNDTHALILIDIDNFKSVNDTSGHLAGDHTIRIVADLISSHFRKTDIVGRIGGDEFIVLMQEVPSLEIVRAKVNELVQLMKYKPNLTIPENVSLSIGFATTNGCITSYDTLFRKADEALYLAKDNGKARYQEYGREPRSVLDDDRPAALLIGRSRSVCSTVQALVPQEVRIVEALSLPLLQRIPAQEKKSAVIAFVDATDPELDAARFWAALCANGVPAGRTVAIVAEGDLDGCRAALAANVADLLLSPIDRAAFKRCTTRVLTGRSEALA